MSDNKKGNKNKMGSAFSNLAKNAKKRIEDNRDLKRRRLEAEANLDKIVQEKAGDDERLAGFLAYDMINGQTDNIIKKQWKLIYILIGLFVVSFIANIAMMASSDIYPILVRQNGNNQIIGVEKANRMSTSGISPATHTYLIEQFVKNARSVSIDGQLESELMKNSYAFTQGAATKTLQDFISQRDPYAMASSSVISVTINNVNPNVGGSDETTQIIWTETARDPKTNQLISRKSYTGQFTFVQKNKPSLSPDIDLYNPFGFYITHVTWTENYNTYH